LLNAHLDHLEEEELETTVVHTLTNVKEKNVDTHILDVNGQVVQNINV